MKSMSPASDNGARPTDPAVDSLDRCRENLRRALGPRAINAEEVERVLGAFVAQLKEQGASPEAVVIAVKKLLAEREPPPADGEDAAKAFQAAGDNHDLDGAIVTLSIAQYYGIRLRATDITPGPGEPGRRGENR